MGLFDSIKNLQNLADQAKNVVERVKNNAGISFPASKQNNIAAVPSTHTVIETAPVVPDSSGQITITSVDQMASWLNSLPQPNASAVTMKVLESQMQVIQFVRTPSLLGMVLDNMIATLYQTLKQTTTAQEKENTREIMSAMIQNLIFFSDAQLHYMIDQNKQEAKQLLSQAGNMLAKSVANVAVFTAGPTAIAGVVLKNVFNSEEVQNGFFGRLIGWIMDRGEIDKRVEDFNTSLKNMFETFDKYATLMGPSIQIHGMLRRYERQLITVKSIEVYSGLYRQFISDIGTLNDKGLDLKADESLKNLETLLAPLNISLEGDVDGQDGMLQMIGKIYLGSNITKKISKTVWGENRNLKDTSMNGFNLDFLLPIKEQFDQYIANYSSKIESLKTEIAGLSFIKISAKKELERQCQDATNELSFCNEVATRLSFYISNAKKNEDIIQTYSVALSNITSKYSFDSQTISAPIESNPARQMFDTMFNVALSDGVITEEEIEILRPYAVSAGISEGEFKLMIINKTNFK